MRFWRRSGLTEVYWIFLFLFFITAYGAYSRPKWSENVAFVTAVISFREFTQTPWRDWWSGSVCAQLFQAAFSAAAGFPVIAFLRYAVSSLPSVGAPYASWPLHSCRQCLFPHSARWKNIIPSHLAFCSRSVLKRYCFCQVRKYCTNIWDFCCYVTLVW